MSKKPGRPPLDPEEQLPGMSDDEVHQRMTGAAGDRLTDRLRQVGWTDDSAVAAGQHD